MGEHILQLHSVHNREGPLQKGLGNLEANKVVILLRGVAVLRDLHGVETKLGFQVSGLILRIAYGFAILRPQFRILIATA